MDSLETLAPVSESYASLPVAQAFDWQRASAELGVGEWYLVAFRSIRRDDADEERLTALDSAAHQEAAGAPGFVHYFKGPKADDGSCLSFCLWDSRADARAAAGLPAHRDAVAVLDEMYATYTLEFQRVSRHAPDAPLAFEPYDRWAGQADPGPAPADPGFDPSFAPA
jgi:heme-degrading monooxygenase HmoA